MKKPSNRMLSLLLALMLIAPLAYAGNVYESANSDQYGKKAGGMLGRGVINVLSSPVDLIVHTAEKTKQGPPFIGTLSGIGSGAGCTVLRAVSGAFDIVTFWVPNFNGVPVSRSYSNCLDGNSGYVSSEYTSSASSSSSTHWSAQGTHKVAPSTATTTSWPTSTTEAQSVAWPDDSSSQKAQTYVMSTESGNAVSTTQSYVDKSGKSYKAASSSSNPYSNKSGSHTSSNKYLK